MAFHSCPCLCLVQCTVETSYYVMRVKTPDDKQHWFARPGKKRTSLCASQAFGWNSGQSYRAEPLPAFWIMKSRSTMWWFRQWWVGSLWIPGLHSKLQVSQGYGVRPCLEIPNPITKKKKKPKTIGKNKCLLSNPWSSGVMTQLIEM